MENKKIIETKIICKGCGYLLADCSLEVLAYALGCTHIMTILPEQVKRGSVFIRFSCPKCRQVKYITFIKRKNLKMEKKDGDKKFKKRNEAKRKND